LLPANTTALRATPLPSPVNLLFIGPLHNTETLLFHLKTYIDSSFSNGVWTIGSDGGCRSHLGSHGGIVLVEAWGRFPTIVQRMPRFEDVQILSILDPAFRSFRLATREETLRAFSFILSALLAIRRYGRNDLVGVLLRFLSTMSREVFGRHHHRRLRRKL